MVVASVNWPCGIRFRREMSRSCCSTVACQRTTPRCGAGKYAPELEKRLGPRLKPTNKSGWVDQTCIRVKGKWTLSIPCGGSAAATIGFRPSAHLDTWMTCRSCSPRRLGSVWGTGRRFLALPLSRPVEVVKRAQRRFYGCCLAAFLAKSGQDVIPWEVFRTVEED
jgi:hypothetical protein